MEEKRYWLGFNLVPQIGPMRVRALLEAFGSLEAAWHASGTQLQAVGLDRRALQNLTTMRAALDLEQEWAKVERSGISILTWQDKDYPRLLREIADAPPVLYVYGELLPSDDWAIAVVGTRRTTRYGRQVAEQFATDLARAEITVVSGLARGIDSIAHKSALAAGGRTIAVLGCGLDTVYPPENRNLAIEIARQGALISEYPLGTKPEGRNFPPRNRIISGLSLGTLVVEGDVKSGAMITARDALEQSREVFAVPGNVNARQSRGTNSLIRDSAAKLVMTVDDILVELNLNTVQHQAEMRQLVPENAVEARLLQELSTEPVHIDEICQSVGMPVSEVSSSLTLMELKGLVKQVGGMTYVVAREVGPHYTAV